MFIKKLFLLLTLITQTILFKEWWEDSQVKKLNK